MVQQKKALMTPKVKALIGQTSEVVEMYGTVDIESIRRFCNGIPDQDPRHWDEALAKPRFGGVTAPVLMVTYIARRKPPWEEDMMDQITAKDWHTDGGGGMGRKAETLPSLRSVAGTHSHLHAGDSFEVFRFPRVGDKIFFQTKYLDIQEKIGRRGETFLLVTTETRFWNQNDETICIFRATGAER